MNQLKPLPDQLVLAPLPEKTICYHSGCITTLTSEIARARNQHCERKFVRQKALANIMGNTENKDLKMTDSEITAFNDYVDGNTTFTIVFGCRGCHREVIYTCVESTGEIAFPEKQYRLDKITTQEPVRAVPSVTRTKSYDVQELRHVHILWYPDGTRP